MYGKFNPKTRRYEDINGNPVSQPYTEGYTPEEQDELRRIAKVNAEGGTYLERYARELGVDQTTLFKDLMDNNGIEVFSSVRSYEEFKMLKCTYAKRSALEEIFDNMTSYLRRRGL